VWYIFLLRLFWRPCWQQVGTWVAWLLFRWHLGVRKGLSAPEEGLCGIGSRYATAKSGWSKWKLPKTVVWNFKMIMSQARGAKKRRNFTDIGLKYQQSGSEARALWCFRVQCTDTQSSGFLVFGLFCVCVCVCVCVCFVLFFCFCRDFPLFPP